MLKNKLDKTIPVPLYYQLKELIISEIKNGNYTKDSLIPTEKEFSEYFQISRTTVRQAITELVQEGYLYRIKSKGTFVSRPKINQDFIQKLESFNDQIKRTGMVPSTEVLDFKVIKAAAEVASKLEINPDDKVIFLHRRRFANSEPIVVIKTYLPYNRCAFVLDHDFTKESLYSVLSQDESVKVYYVKRLVEAVEATSTDIKYLGIKSKIPIQFFTSVGYNIYGQPIEYSLARYRGDRNSFEVTVFVDK